MLYTFDRKQPFQYTQEFINHIIQNPKSFNSLDLPSENLTDMIGQDFNIERNYIFFEVLYDEQVVGFVLFVYDDNDDCIQYNYFYNPPRQQKMIKPEIILGKYEKEPLGFLKNILPLITTPNEDLIQDLLKTDWKDADDITLEAVVKKDNPYYQYICNTNKNNGFEEQPNENDSTYFTKKIKQTL